MKIGTLGPKETDSYRATIYWINKYMNNDFEIILFDAYEALFCKLKNLDYILMPVGYINRQSKNYMAWVDFHFKYLKKLTIYTLFHLPTKEMLLVENSNPQIDKAVIQAATFELLKEANTENCDIVYVSSKPRALTLFLKEKYRYTICSSDDYYLRKKDIDLIIRDSFRPEMIWVVYKVNVGVE